MISIEFPNTITEIITIISFLSICLWKSHQIIKNIHFILNKLIEKVDILEENCKNIEERMHEFEDKTNDALLDVRLSTRELQTSVDFIKEMVQCQNLA